ncbi:ABC transporter substrate-binding protein (plasmid) [Rhizobium sp. NIBRBAC000502774]|nr:ABC transporter substrate-binding protein [Rhizobium sp. NIBRBAC000502774]
MEKVKLGLLVSLSGPTGVWAPSCIQSAILGAAEINASGGVDGRELELVIKDADWRPELAVEAAMELIQDDAVSAIVSMMGSHARRAVSFHTVGKCPFIYTPNLEISDHEPGTIAISATDDQMIAPILDWIFERLYARRFVMVGSDYRWSLKTMPMTGAMIRARGGSVDEIIVRPIDSDDDWDLQASDRIRKLQPDLVLVFLVGDQAISFHRNFQASGLASKIPRFAIATDETVLMSLDPNTTEGLFAGAYYFVSARTDANISFMERYWTAFGELAPIPGSYGHELPPISTGQSA